MSSLIKNENGLMFFDDFTERTLMWTLSPSNVNCLSFEKNGLRLKHNKRYCSYTIPEPSIDSYSCIVKLDHIPTDLEDIAGVLVISSNKEYAECQTYLATEPSEITNSYQFEEEIKNAVEVIMTDDKFVKWSIEDDNTSPTISNIDDDKIQVGSFIDTIYKYIKINKSKYMYMFYASHNGYDWIEVGNVKFKDSGTIGFFIYGTDNEDMISKSHCYFNEFAIYNNKYITINGVDRTYEMEIIDGNGRIIFRTDNVFYRSIFSRSTKECMIDTTTLPIPFKDAILRIYPKENYKHTIKECSLGEKVYGGDSFTLERDIRALINNKEVAQFSLYDLGTLSVNDTVKIDIHNYEDYTVHNINIKVLKYSEYYIGEEEMAVSLYDENEEKLKYAKELVINEIGPSEGKSIFVKLIDKPEQNFYKVSHSYRFKIVIE